MMWSASIRFKDDGSEVSGMILSENDGVANEEDVFFYVNGIHCIESLKDPNGVEDFVILDYEVISNDYYKEQYL
jgi:hypothetical protein